MNVNRLQFYCNSLDFALPLPLPESRGKLLLRVQESLATLPTPSGPTVLLQLCSLTHLLFCSTQAPFDHTKWCLWWAIDHGQLAQCFKKKSQSMFSSIQQRRKSWSVGFICLLEEQVAKADRHQGQDGWFYKLPVGFYSFSVLKLDVTITWSH